ncbi:MAG: damage repair protein, partial [Firmicutes bacterium]|nr:damage repair protein [Bacillota bacterium]
MNDMQIVVIDLKAFYAFVECVERHLDPFATPLVVCDKVRGPGTIVLSVSPYLKSMGVPSRCRSFELPKLDNMVYAVP